MVELSGHIASLLEEHDFVILPGAGAFMTSSAPAQIEPGGSFILPPRRRVCFNASMKMDDGILSGHLIRQMGITLQESRRWITEYSDDILYHLDHDGEVVMDNLGTLRKEEGVITFFPLPILEKHPDAFGLNPVSLSTATTGQAPVATPSPEPLPEETAVKSGDRQLKRILLWRQVKRVGLPITGLLILALILLVFIFPGTLFERNPLKNAPLKPPAGTIASDIPEPNLLKEEKEASESGQADSPEIDETHNLREEIQTLGTASGKSENLTGDKGNPESDPIHPSSSGGEIWYVIAGSFKSPQNAETLITQLKQRGYNPVNLGLAGSYYLVAIDSFFTAREASRALNRFDDLYPDKEAWVYHLSR